MIILIDRRGKSDVIYVYQLPKRDELNHDFCEETLSYLTQSAVIPNEEMAVSDLDLAVSMKGGGLDIGGRNFVISFHIHSMDDVKYQQFIKGQKLPFLPYHMILLWKNYFKNGWNKLNEDKYNIQSVYGQWKLPLNDRMLKKWSQEVDPLLYKLLYEYHWKYIKN